jgi:hypothetical protein
MSNNLVRVVSAPKISVTVNTTIGEEDVFVGFAPGRTLFVAKSWPTGVDASLCFTDVPAALTAAAALTPPPDVSNPALIVLYPGLYSQPVTLMSNVHLLGCSPKGCSITGAVSYSPGVGVNASQSSLVERVYMSRFGISGAFTIDASGKPLGQGVTVDCRDVDISANLTFHGRATTGGQDFFQTWDGVHGGTAWLFDGAIPSFNNGSQLGASTVTLTNCAFGATFSGCQCFSTLNLVNTPGASGQGNKFANVNVDGTSVFGPIPGSKTGIVTVAAGGSADLRGGEYLAASNLAGSGVIDRNLWRTTVGPTSSGANVVALEPAYLNANYNAHVTQTAGTPTAVTVTNKAAVQLILNDAVGGNTFDITIVKE